MRTIWYGKSHISFVLNLLPFPLFFFQTNFPVTFRNTYPLYNMQRISSMSEKYVKYVLHHCLLFVIEYGLTAHMGHFCA